MFLYVVVFTVEIIYIQCYLSPFALCMSNNFYTLKQTTPKVSLWPILVMLLSTSLLYNVYVATNKQTQKMSS